VYTVGLLKHAKGDLDWSKGVGTGAHKVEKFGKNRGFLQCLSFSFLFPSHPFPAISHPPIPFPFLPFPFSIPSFAPLPFPSISFNFHSLSFPIPPLSLPFLPLPFSTEQGGSIRMLQVLEQPGSLFRFSVVSHFAISSLHTSVAQTTCLQHCVQSRQRVQT